MKSKERARLNTAQGTAVTAKKSVEDLDRRFEAYKKETEKIAKLKKWERLSLKSCMLFLFGLFWDYFAPHLVKTRFLSFTHNPDIGLGQGFCMVVGVILLILSGVMYERVKHGKKGGLL